MSSYAEFAEADGSVRMAGELLYPNATPTDVLTVQSDGSIAAASGGGSSSIVVRGPFSFDYTQAAALADGVAFYTPTVGDILLDAWIEVNTAFDGTTPQADISGFQDASFGWFANAQNAIDLTGPDAGGDASGFNGLLYNEYGPGNGNFPLTLAAAFNTDGNFMRQRSAPGKFTATDPLLLVVSQDGQKGGTAIDSAQGAGKVYIVTATPTAF